MEKTNHDVFISFSFQDYELAMDISTKLNEVYNIKNWICTEEIKAGENFKSVINDAIAAAKIVLLIQSRNSISSREVPKEIALALEKQKTIIPFVIDDAGLQGALEYDLIGIHNIDAQKPTMDERISELAQRIYVLLEKTDSENRYGWADRKVPAKLMSTPSVIPKSVFLGREKELSEINRYYSEGNRVLFLQGAGGIGKTQIAKQYACRYKENYDVIVFAVYNESIKKMMVADSPFVIQPRMERLILADGNEEDDNAFFDRKLAKINSISNKRVLIIIDNFDVEADPDICRVIDGSYNLLITTRNDYSKLYPTVKIGAIESIDVIKEVFMENYQGYMIDSDDPHLEELIELVNRHTYTVELLAQHMELSGQTSLEMIDALREKGIKSLDEEIIDSDLRKHVAYENLLRMFDMFMLSETERKVLVYLSFMPLDGVNARSFINWAGLDSFKVIKELERKSWLIKNVEGIALHPIIREVVKLAIKADEECCKEFLERFTFDIEDKKMWGAPKEVKRKYAAIAKEVIKRFDVITPATEQLYEHTQSLFSYYVDLDKAIELSGRLYDYYVERYGERHFNSARAAFKCGWVRSFNVESIGMAEEAVFWLERADKLFCEIRLNTSDEVSRHTMTKTNLSKMNLHIYARTGERERYESAKHFAKEALTHARENFCPGDFHYVKIGGAGTHLAEVLFEGEEYEAALEVINDAIANLLDATKDEKNVDMSFAYFIKAHILFRLGNAYEARVLAEKCLGIYESYFGEKHPRCCKLSYLIGECFEVEEECELAIESYTKALKIAEMTFDAASEEIKRIRDKIKELKL